MDNVFFDPWVGENYHNGGIFDKKILVLGESLYCANPECIGLNICGKGKADEAKCQTTKRTVMGHLNRHPQHGRWTNTFTKFERAMVGKHTDQSNRKELWDSLIFHNYVQNGNIEKALESPTKESFLAGRVPFFEVLEEYRPQLVIAWGRRLWEKMPTGDVWVESEPLLLEEKKYRCGYYTLKDGTKVMMMHVHHPSYRGFSPPKWHKVINKFITTY